MEVPKGRPVKPRAAIEGARTLRIRDSLPLADCSDSLQALCHHPFTRKIPANQNIGPAPTQIVSTVEDSSCPPLTTPGAGNSFASAFNDPQ